VLPIFAGSMLPIIIKVLLVIHVLVSLLIILLVLMQRPKNEGLGAAFGGGMTENLFGAQTTNVLQTITRWLGGIFFGLTLLLSYLYVKQTHQGSSIQRQLSAPTVIPAPATRPELPAPGAETSPGTPGSETPSVAAPAAVSPPVKADGQPLEKEPTGAPTSPAAAPSTPPTGATSDKPAETPAPNSQTEPGKSAAENPGASPKPETGQQPATKETPP
jgi:preprotein translocase subunit SecG